MIINFLLHILVFLKTSSTKKQNLRTASYCSTSQTLPIRSNITSLPTAVTQLHRENVKRFLNTVIVKIYNCFSY